MQRISVFIPDETKKRISIASKARGKEESEIIRVALDQGLNVIYPKSSSVRALLDLAKQAETMPSEQGEPTDISTNLDYYAWGGEKKKK
jgi:predicted DNA-binding protein